MHVPSKSQNSAERAFMDIPKVDLRGVELEPGLPRWEEARAAVTASMVAHGCVVVAYGDALGPELRQALFGRDLPELFALPLETKQRNNVSTKAHLRGYIATPVYESVSVSVDGHGPTDEGSIRDFTNLFWPKGNLEFSDMMLRFVNNLLKLRQMVSRMTLEGLGVPEEKIRSHLGSLTHTLRLCHYGVQSQSHTGSGLSLSMGAHRDFIMSTLVMQHEVDGLEVQAMDGSWILIPPKPDTFTFQAGDLLTVVTNGRVPASVHRVRTPRNRERFSLVFGTWSRDGEEVSTMDELVDGENPLLYNPCRPDEYIEFVMTKEGYSKLDDPPLKAFCGVHKSTYVHPWNDHK